MELKSDILHNLIDLEIENIDFLLELIHSNKNLSLSLINAFISTIELQSSPEDLEFFNKMILELKVILDDNIALQNELVEIKEKFKSITTRLDKKVLVSALDEFKQKQERIRDIELRLYSFTPKLLNRISINLSNMKRNELRKEIEKVIPKKVEQLSEEAPVTPKEVTEQKQETTVEENKEEIIEEQKEQIESTETSADNQDSVDQNVTESEATNEDNSTNVETEVVSEADSTEKDNDTIEVKPVIDETTTNTTSNAINNELVNESHRASVDSLIISEITGEVILPFTHTTIDIKEFKNPVSSRFREGYRLSKERENEGVLTSISIGLKLSFKSKIHPAIIRACRDFDDLDTYLYYLDNNQVEYFPNFKILYKAYPMKNYLNKNEN